jgi:hypothetical protein
LDTPRRGRVETKRRSRAITFLPKLEGDGMFPAGHRSSHLTIGEMASLIEMILAWTAKEGLTVQHFDERQAA